MWQPTKIQASPLVQSLEISLLLRGWLRQRASTLFAIRPIGILILSLYPENWSLKNRIHAKDIKGLGDTLVFSEGKRSY
ncbi:hypothetical protein CMK10_03975 [Candidatus Poribacteria bacterium]|nr:hypothetical protein [Candidatus Poribacteria bacterium]